MLGAGAAADVDARDDGGGRAVAARIKRRVHRLRRCHDRRGDSHRLPADGQAVDVQIQTQGQPAHFDPAGDIGRGSGQQPDAVFGAAPRTQQCTVGQALDDRGIFVRRGAHVQVGGHNLRVGDGALRPGGRQTTNQQDHGQQQRPQARREGLQSLHPSLLQTWIRHCGQEAIVMTGDTITVW